MGQGFTIIDVTPERVQADYYLTSVPTTAQPDPRVDPTAVPTYNTSWQTVAGTKKITPASGPVGKRSHRPLLVGDGDSSAGTMVTSPSGQNLHAG